VERILRQQVRSEICHDGLILLSLLGCKRAGANRIWRRYLRASSRQSRHVARQLSLIGEAGANSVRDDVHWSHVEPQKGHLIIPRGVDDLVNQALKANVQPLLILDYGNSFYDSGNKPVTPEALSAFARFAAFVVQHFKGRVHMYEMWNEWDDTTGGTRRGTPQEYARFLRVVYPAVKANDRSAVFLAGAISVGGLDCLSAMLSAGALGSFDALSIHPYNFSKHTRNRRWLGAGHVGDRSCYSSLYGRPATYRCTLAKWDGPRTVALVGVHPKRRRHFSLRCSCLLDHELSQRDLVVQLSR